MLELIQACRYINYIIIIHKWMHQGQLNQLLVLYDLGRGFEEVTLLLLP